MANVTWHEQPPAGAYLLVDPETYTDEGVLVPGPQGETGPAGPQGEPGPQGIAGQTGPQGPAGDTGADGAPGVKGDTGTQGIAGPTGPQGQAGPQGIQGVKGTTGATGAKGSTGLTGPQGPTGPTGPQGPAGPQLWTDTAATALLDIPDWTAGNSFYQVRGGWAYLAIDLKRENTNATGASYVWKLPSLAWPAGGSSYAAILNQSTMGNALIQIVGATFANPDLRGQIIIVGGVNVGQRLRSFYSWPVAS